MDAAYTWTFKVCHFQDDLPWKKAKKPFSFLISQNNRNSRCYFTCQEPGTSLILKESPIGVRQTHPWFRLANLNG